MYPFFDNVIRLRKPARHCDSNFHREKQSFLVLRYGVCQTWMIDCFVLRNDDHFKYLNINTDQRHKETKILWNELQRNTKTLH